MRSKNSNVLKIVTPSHWLGWAGHGNVGSKQGKLEIQKKKRNLTENKLLLFSYLLICIISKKAIRQSEPVLLLSKCLISSCQVCLSHPSPFVCQPFLLRVRHLQTTISLSPNWTCYWGGAEGSIGISCVVLVEQEKLRVFNCLRCCNTKFYKCGETL